MNHHCKSEGIGKGLCPLWRAVIFYVVLNLLLPAVSVPTLAMADEGFRLFSPAASFIIPLQEEGRLVVSGAKPWYKKWWVWSILLAAVGGVAASGGGQSSAAVVTADLRRVVNRFDGSFSSSFFSNTIWSLGRFRIVDVGMSSS